MSEYKPFFHFLIIIHSLFYATSDLCRHCRALKILPTASQWPAFREKPRLEKITYVLPSSSTHPFKRVQQKKSKLLFFIIIIHNILLLLLLLLFTVYSKYLVLFIYKWNKYCLTRLRFHSFLFSPFSIKLAFAKIRYLHRKLLSTFQENARIETRFPCCLP